MQNLKRITFEVTAESPWGVERGVNAALQLLSKGQETGEHAIPKHGVHVKWFTNNLMRPTGMDVVESGVVVAPPEPEKVVEPIAPVIPDISKMDIEDAKGIVGSAISLEELEMLKNLEADSERYPGGRKGVIQFIEKMRKDILNKAKEAEEGSKEVENDTEEA